MAQNLVEYVLAIKTKAAEKGINDLTADLDKLIKELKDVDKKGKSSFKKTNESAKKTNKTFKKTQREAKKTKKALTAIGAARSVFGKLQFAVAGITAALGLTFVAAFKVAQKVTDLTNELNDLSVRSGVTAKSIQGLRQALLASGQPASELNTILGAVSTRFATFSVEGGAVEKKFNDLGISVLDANGKLRSNNDIMLDGIKKLQSIGDASERSRVAVLLFGKAGSKLNQALAAGNFENFLEFTEKFGIDTGPKASKSAAEFQVALSSLQTAFNGSLQRLTEFLDGQDAVTNGMIKLGSTIVFTISLIEGFGKAYKNLNKTFTNFLEVSLEYTITTLMGPLFTALNLVSKAAGFLGIEVDDLANSLRGLLGIALEKTIDPTNSLADAFDNAVKEGEKYQKLVRGFGGSMNGLANASGEAAGQIAKVGKETKTTTEDIRTFMDVVDDLLGKFTSFNINKFISDFSLGFDFLSKKIDKVFDISKIDRWTNNLRSSLLDATTLASTSDPLQIPEMVIESTKMSGLKELLTKIKVGFGEAASIAAKGLSRIGGKVGGALSKGLSVGATTAITGILAVLKIAGSLGQRGSTVKEVEKSVEEDIRARAKAIELGLQALPRILVKVLPPILIEFVDRLIFGLLKGFAEQFNMVINFIKSIFTREGRQERKAGRKDRQEARGEEFRSRLEQLVGIAGFRSGGKYIPSAKGGIKFTGADEGLAMLHRGEFVVPETGQMPQAVQRTMGMGGSGINITINASVVESNAVDELVRQIERRFQTFGSSTSPLFGGR